MKKKPIIFIVMTVILAVYVFFAAPNLNPIYPDGAFFWLVVVSAYLLVAAATSFRFAEITENNGRAGFHLDKSKLPKKWALVVLAVLWVLYFAVNLIFTPLFFWGSYRDQMAEPEVKQFTSEMQAIDLNQIPIVDKNLASTLADKKLGEKPSLGSQVRPGEPTIQTVDGKLVWVVPLQHSGFFKWLANLSGSAGYIVVSATNVQDVQYIDSYKIKIQPDCYFLDDLERKARFSGGLFTGITDYSFELDDSGKPYWVVTTYKNTCGFRLPEATGVLMVDAQTGQTERFSLENVPEWVDRVQPEDFIINQINNKGNYIHGIFNFSNHEKYRTSEGHNIVYNNGSCYLFTGITSVGVDDSATGFIMVDMVTKEPILYRMSGATENAAMTSAAGKVQDLGYYATFPIILNINDQPTYFMTLKDNANLIKKYSFVNVKDYMIVGVGDTMSEAEQDYRKAMRNISNSSGLDESDGGKATEEKLTGTVGRISSYQAGSEGIAYYAFTLSEKPGVIFTAELSVSEKLPLTASGDQVSITYLPKENNATVTAFDNQTLFGAASQQEPPASSVPETSSEQ